jgi:CheY-like chemotaxis protein
MKPPLTVLLAEDNEDDLFLSKRVLDKAGIGPILHVENGKEARDYLAGQGPYQDRSRFPLPDVVLLDLKMPLWTGHEVLEWLRSQPQFRELKVYVLTSSDEERDRNRVEKAGIQGYFVKPLAAAHLGEILKD